nr:decarboxylating cobalt-precorrin-6B (C(15))-methyltransferase [uncultured Peptostreptococcus sp.]
MKNSEFIVGKVPITKEEVRAISLAKLDLTRASNFLDIGSGTGSVTVEAALNNRHLRVTSIEKDQAALDLTRLNIEKFDLKNVVLIDGNAPLDPEKSGLNKSYQAIFLGGSGENLGDILDWSYQLLDQGGRLVSNFILLENATKAYRIMEDIGFKKIELVQVGVSVLEGLGGGHYLKPRNPIVIISGEK